MASVSVLDDEALENLMMETGDYVTFLAQHSHLTPADTPALTLPAKLSYLQDYVKFTPEWLPESHPQRCQGDHRQPSQGQCSYQSRNEGQGQADSSQSQTDEGQGRSFSESDSSPQKRTFSEQSFIHAHKAIVIPQQSAKSQSPAKTVSRLRQEMESKTKVKAVLPSQPATYHPLQELGAVATVASQKDWHQSK